MHGGIQLRTASLHSPTPISTMGPMAASKNSNITIKVIQLVARNLQTSHRPPLIINKGQVCTKSMMRQEFLITCQITKVLCNKTLVMKVAMETPHRL